MPLWRIPVVEVVHYSKVYFVEADSADEALGKAVVGETESEQYNGLIGVVDRQAQEAPVIAARQMREWPCRAVRGRWRYQTLDPLAYVFGQFRRRGRDVIFEDDGGMVFTARDFDRGEYFQEVAVPAPQGEVDGTDPDHG